MEPGPNRSFCFHSLIGKALLCEQKVRGSKPLGSTQPMAQVRSLDKDMQY